MKLIRIHRVTFQVSSIHVFPESFRAFCSWKLIKMILETKISQKYLLKEDCQHQINTVIKMSENVFNWLWFLFPLSWQSENKYISLVLSHPSVLVHVSLQKKTKNIWHRKTGKPETLVGPSKWLVRMVGFVMLLKPQSCRLISQSFCLPDGRKLFLFQVFCRLF